MPRSVLWLFLSLHVKDGGVLFHVCIYFSLIFFIWGGLSGGFEGVGGAGCDDDASASNTRGSTALCQDASPCGGIESVNGAPFDPKRHYVVALPRNLLKGFCSIAPLVEWADEADRQHEKVQAQVRR